MEKLKVKSYYNLKKNKVSYRFNILFIITVLFYNVDVL